MFELDAGINWALRVSAFDKRLCLGSFVRLLVTYKEYKAIRKCEYLFIDMVRAYLRYIENVFCFL